MLQSTPAVHLGALFDSVDGVVIPDGIVVVDGSRVCSGPSAACDLPDALALHDLPAAPEMLPGWALHLELEALVRGGMTPIEALQAATSVNARLLDRDDLGHLRSGARADLFIVEGDPTTDISTTRNVRAVWFGGETIHLDAAWAESMREGRPTAY